MASITIRNIDDRLKRRLRMRAAAQGHSMEEEARQILRTALDTQRPRSLADLALEMFGHDHGVELEPHPPVDVSPPDFGPR